MEAPIQGATLSDMARKNGTLTTHLLRFFQEEAEVLKGETTTTASTCYHPTASNRNHLPGLLTPWPLWGKVLLGREEVQVNGAHPAEAGAGVEVVLVVVMVRLILQTVQIPTTVGIRSSPVKFVTDLLATSMCYRIMRGHTQVRNPLNAGSVTSGLQGITT